MLLNHGVRNLFGNVTGDPQFLVKTVLVLQIS